MIGHAFMAGLIGGAGGEPATFDPTAKGVDVALSGGDLTVTWSQVAGWQNVRTTSAKAGGRFYIELNIGGSAPDVGLWRVGDYLPNGSSVNGATGGVGVNLGGATCQVAVDLERWLLWRRTSPAGNWNDNPSADPVGGVGGVDLSSITGDVYFVICGANQYAGPGTANFGATAFAADPPYGYERWTA